eukprot:855098_1
MIVNTPRSQSRGFLSGKNVYFVIFGLLLVLGLCCTLGPRLFSGNSKDLGSVPEIHSNSNLDAGNGRIASQPSVEPDQETKNSSDDDMPPIFLNGVNNSYVAYQDPQNDPSSFSGTQSNMNFDAVNGGIASQPSVGSERNTDISTHIDDTLSASDFNGADQSTLLSAPPINAPINFAQNSDGIFSTTPKLYQPLTSYIPVQTSGPNTDPTIWECPSCTFPNASSAKACKICNAKNENIKTDSPSNSNVPGANNVDASQDSKQTSNVSTEFGPNSGDSLLGVQQHNSNSGDLMVGALQHNPNSGTPQHDPNSDDSHSGGSLLGDLFQFQTLPVKPYVPTVYHGRLLEQMSDPKTDPTIWECPSCTFPNASSAKACKICNAKNENIKTDSPSNSNLSGANGVAASQDSQQTSNVSTDSPSNSNVSGANRVDTSHDSKQTSNVSTEPQIPVQQKLPTPYLHVYHTKNRNGERIMKVDALDAYPNNTKYFPPETVLDVFYQTKGSKGLIDNLVSFGIMSYDNMDGFYTMDIPANEAENWRTVRVRARNPTFETSWSIAGHTDHNWQCSTCKDWNTSSYHRKCASCSTPRSLEDYERQSPEFDELKSEPPPHHHQNRLGGMEIVEHLDHNITPPDWGCRKEEGGCSRSNPGYYSSCAFCGRKRGVQNFVQVNALFKSTDGCKVFFQNQAEDTGVCPVRVLNNMFQLTGEEGRTQFTKADWDVAQQQFDGDDAESTFKHLGKFGQYRIVQPLEPVFNKACAENSTLGWGKKFNVLGFIYNMFHMDDGEYQGGHWSGFRKICGSWYFMESLKSSPVEKTTQEVCELMTSTGPNGSMNKNILAIVED